jgi:3-hydroxybutyryl-CoA dehydratase
MGIKEYRFRGKGYEDWEIGEEFVTGARTITEGDIVTFAGLSGDWSATHTNDVYGRSTIFKSRIAYGNVTFIVSTGLLAQTLLFEGTAMALLDMKISYQEPVRFEDTIYCRFKAVEKRRSQTAGRGIVTFQVLVFNQKDEQVAEERLIFLVADHAPCL